MKRASVPASSTPEYRTWCAMRERCGSKKHRAYPRYGGRGITVCERWQKFSNFLADMGARPPGTSIDRIDNNGNYEPGNCRWATAIQQRRNQSPPVSCPSRSLAREPSSLRRNVVGLRFGSLTAKGVAYTYGRRHTYWLCVCDCGGHRTLRIDHLQSTPNLTCGSCALSQEAA
jgi:hypothetical protein